jgi:hypothetical protein
MTRNELVRRRDDLQQELKAYGSYLSLSGLKWKRDELQTINQQLATIEECEQRAALTTVLQPVQSYWRHFIKALADHAVALALEHKILVRAGPSIRLERTRANGPSP